MNLENDIKDSVTYLARQGKFLVSRLAYLEQFLKEKGKDGKTPVKGVDYFDGKDAPDPEPIIDRKLESAIPQVIIKAASLIPKPKDGKDASDPIPYVNKEIDKRFSEVKEELPILASRVVSLIPGPVLDERLEAHLPKVVEMAVAQIPVPKDGEDGKDGKDSPMKRVRGEWSKDESYKIGDVVYTGGASFVALRDNTGKDPFSDQEKKDEKKKFWQIIAAGVRGGFAYGGVNNQSVRGQITFNIDDGGGVLTTGSRGFIRIPFDCIVTGWEILSTNGTSGSIVVDVKRCSYDDFPTTSSIAGSEKPTISNSTKNRDLTITSWTTAQVEGQYLEFVIDSITNLTSVQINILTYRS